MKPKTKIAKQIVAMSDKLPRVDVVRYADKLFPHMAFSTAHKVNCLECGASWGFRLCDADPVSYCPICDRTLRAGFTKKRKGKEVRSLGVASMMNGYQLLRFFDVTKHVSIGQVRRITSYEVARLFLDVEKQECHLICMRWPNGYVTWTGDLEYRGKFKLTDSRLNEIYPHLMVVKSIHPILKRNGLRSSFFDICPMSLITMLLQRPFVETLFKAGYTKVVKHISAAPDSYQRYWPSMKIAIRSKYKISDPSMWFDYLGFLYDLNMDPHNPTLVCPKNLAQAHDHYMEAANARRERTREQQRIENAAREAERKLRKAEIFEKVKSWHRDISFKSSSILIKALGSIEEYIEEGKAMHHCVAGYASKAKSLILSARSLESGDRIETIEVSLDNFQIVQSRGVCNSQTERHVEILSLVEQNMRQIKQIAKQQAV